MKMFIMSIIIAGALLVSCIISFDYIAYKNFDAYENIYLDDNLVYSGQGRHTWWGQLGEVGNCYYVKVYPPNYWDKFWGKCQQVYTGQKIVIKPE